MAQDALYPVNRCLDRLQQANRSHTDRYMNACAPTPADLVNINQRLAALQRDPKKSHGPADAYVPDFLDDLAYRHIYESALRICAMSLPARRLEKRRLLLVMRNSDRANALVLPFLQFDVILLNRGLLDRIRELVDYFMDSLINSPAARGLGQRHFTLQFIQAQAELGASSAMELAQSIFRCALTFIIGHELGHLASGHLSYGTHCERGALASHESSASFQDLRGQAQELDADMQGWVFSYRLHERGGRAARRAVSADVAGDHKVQAWLWDHKPRMTFLHTVATLVVYAALGLDRPTVGALAHETHPPTSLRAKLLLDSIVLNQVHRDMEHDGQHQMAAREARLVFGIAIAAHQRNLGQPGYPSDERVVWGAQLDNPQKFAMDALAALGLLGPDVDAVQQVQAHAEALVRKWASLKPHLKSRTRWQAKYLANWNAIGTAQKTRRQRKVKGRPYLIV